MAKLYGKYEEAIRLCEPLLIHRESNVQRSALHALGDIYQRWGLEFAAIGRTIDKYFFESSRIYRKLEKEYGPLTKSEKREMAFAFYNEACCHSLNGDRGDALKVLRESFEADFPRPADALEDKDFESLYSDSEFKRLVNEFK